MIIKHIFLKSRNTSKSVSWIRKKTLPSFECLWNSYSWWCQKLYQRRLSEIQDNRADISDVYEVWKRGKICLKTGSNCTWDELIDGRWRLRYCCRSVGSAGRHTSDKTAKRYPRCTLRARKSRRHVMCRDRPFLGNCRKSRCALLDYSSSIWSSEAQCPHLRSVWWNAEERQEEAKCGDIPWQNSLRKFSFTHVVDKDICWMLSHSYQETERKDLESKFASSWSSGTFAEDINKDTTMETERGRHKFPLREELQDVLIDLRSCAKISQRMMQWCQDLQKQRNSFGKENAD